VIPIRILNGSTLYINAELVETLTAVPDTVITLTTGRKILTRTSPEEILAAVLDYRRRIHQAPIVEPRAAAADAGAAPSPARRAS